MYSSVHAASGVGIYMLMSSLGSPVPLTMAAALASHHYMDYLGESECYGGFKTGVLIDTVMIQGFIITSAYLLLGWEAACCGLLANFMDFFDKFRSKILNKKEIFPCHSPDFKIKKYFTPNETKDINLISTVLIIILMIMKYIS